MTTIARHLSQQMRKNPPNFSVILGNFLKIGSAKCTTHTNIKSYVIVLLSAILAKRPKLPTVLYLLAINARLFFFLMGIWV